MSVDSDTAHAVTRLVDAGCFLLAATTTAWRRRFGLAVLFVIAAMETYAKRRYDLVALARTWLLGDHPTDVAKYAVQIKVLAAAAILGTAMLLLVLRRLRKQPAELVLWTGVLGVLAIFVVETISYHHVDVIIYQVQWGMMRSGWLYAVAALVATTGALMLPRR